MRSAASGARSSSPAASLAHFRSWSRAAGAFDVAANGGALLKIGWETDVRASARRKSSVPTLALHLDRDTVVPIEVGREMACLIPGCRFVQLDGENHMPLANEPAWPKIVAEIDAFLGAGR